MENRFFPATQHEALALLYVKLRATAETSPAELYKLYQSAYAQIRDARKADRTDKASQRVMY